MTLTRRGLLGAGLGTLIISQAHAQTSADDLRQLTHDPDQPVLGNPDGDVTLIEFYDYQCLFCRKSYPDIRRLVERDGNLRLVMKDWPIFGDLSVHALKIALGAGNRYEAVHDAIMAVDGRQITDAQVDAAARSVGVEPRAAHASFIRSEARWDGLLQRNHDQARMLGLPGTPAFLIGIDLFPGVVPNGELEAVIARMRRR